VSKIPISLISTLAISSIFLISCGSDHASPTSGATTNSGNAQAETLSAESAATVSVTMLKSSYITIPELQLIDGNYTFTELPLGYGVSFDSAETLRYTTKNCVTLKPEVVKAAWSGGGFSNATTKSEITKNSNPFSRTPSYLRDAEKLSPDIEAFVESASKNLSEGGSVASDYRGVSSFGSIFGPYDKNVWDLEGCKKPDGISTRYLSLIEFGVFYYAVAKINFKDSAAIKQWRQTNDEYPTHSVFGDSKLEPSAVAKMLRKSGASLEIFILQSGGSVDKTKASLKELNCTTQNIESCRKLFSHFGKAVFQQIPAELTLTNWNKFAVVGFNTEGFHRK